jgi:protein-tyrosine phosphatase
VIDTHCHLLPGIDDGPDSLAASVEEAAQLVAGGVTFVLCTPHYSREFNTDHELALTLSRTLSDRLEEVELGLGLAVAAEVGAVQAVSAPLEELHRRSVGGRFVLVDVSPSTPAPYFESVCHRLERADLLPIFAHPERCRAVQRRLTIVDGPRRRGALFQVVAPSLAGSWGDEVAATALRLLDTGRVDLLASDAHGRKPPVLREAREIVAGRLGDHVADLLTRDHPARVIEGVHPTEAARSSLRLQL